MKTNPDVGTAKLYLKTRKSNQMEDIIQHHNVQAHKQISALIRSQTHKKHINKDILG